MDHDKWDSMNPGAKVLSVAVMAVVVVLLIGVLSLAVGGVVWLNVWLWS